MPVSHQDQGFTRPHQILHIHCPSERNNDGITTGEDKQSVENGQKECQSVRVYLPPSIGADNPVCHSRFGKATRRRAHIALLSHSTVSKCKRGRDTNTLLIYGERDTTNKHETLAAEGLRDSCSLEQASSVRSERLQCTMANQKREVWTPL